MNRRLVLTLFAVLSAMAIPAGAGTLVGPGINNGSFEQGTSGVWHRPLAANIPFWNEFQMYGIQAAAVVAAVDVVRGLAVGLGFRVIDVPGATGFLDTNYRGKGDAAVAALDDNDFVLVHIEAPDEAGHLGDQEAKVEAIERIDEHIVGPLLEKLRGFDRWRILVAPDHPTPVGRRTHTRTPPPFCLAGEAVHAVLERPFSEEAAASGDLRIDPGHELMEYFLRA